MGLEPTASGATNRRSNQLNYSHQERSLREKSETVFNKNMSRMK